MTYGILKGSVIRKLFEEINKRPYCNNCHAERSKFAIQDKKGYKCYSNLLLGFSSERVSIPIDILIVAEAHGGGREDNFREQMDVETEIDRLGVYYLRDSLHKFHQKEMRELLYKLNESNKTWIFTDLIKCFVWQGRDDSKKLRGSENKNAAIINCRKYLDKQITILLPKKVLSLGNTVTYKYFNLHNSFKHGSTHSCTINSHSFELVFSIFPSRNTADLWIQHGGWNSIIPKLI